MRRGPAASRASRRRRPMPRRASCGSCRNGGSACSAPARPPTAVVRHPADVRRRQAARRPTREPARRRRRRCQSASAQALFDAAGGQPIQAGRRGARVDDRRPRHAAAAAARAAARRPAAGAPPPVAAAAAGVQPADLDHFKCYEALQPNFRQRTVGTRDQFGQRRARVLRTRQLCNPVSKNGGKVLQPRAHLVCYETRDTGNATPPRTVRRDEPVRPAQAHDDAPEPAVRAVAEAQDGGRGADDAEPDAAARPLPLLRRPAAAGDADGEARRPVRDDDDEGRAGHPAVQPRAQEQRAGAAGQVAPRLLLDHRLADVPPLAVRVRNQFGRAALRIRRPETLCLPSFKQVVQTRGAVGRAAGARPLQVLRGRAAAVPAALRRPARPVRAVARAQVVATRQLCNPVRKNNGRVTQPAGAPRLLRDAATSAPCRSSRARCASPTSSASASCRSSGR